MKRRKRVVGLLGPLGLLGIGMVMGGFLTAHPGSSNVERIEAPIVDWTPPEIAVERIEIEVPVIRELPTLPDVSMRTVRVQTGPSPLDLFRTISNTVIGLALVGVGLLWLRHERQAPVEKGPEDVAA